MKKIVRIFCVVTMLITLFACGEKSVDSKSENKSAKIGKHTVEIVIKDMGSIKVELDGDRAPITVENFINLVKDGFYDGLSFHRVIEGFMIQGGDPNGNGTGGSKQNITGEFEKNGIENTIKHERGVISMARSNDYDSASSQFFIMHADYPSLDGGYAAFGHVLEGMDIVDQIATQTPVVDDNGSVNKSEQPMIETIKLVE